MDGRKNQKEGFAWSKLSTKKCCYSLFLSGHENVDVGFCLYTIWVLTGGLSVEGGDGLNFLLHGVDG